MFLFCHKYLIVMLLSFCTACSSLQPYEEADVVIGHVYKFDSPDKATCLYVKFLPPINDTQPFLFATYPKNKPVSDIHFTDRGVMIQNEFTVSDGLVTFDYQEAGAYQDTHTKHAYFLFGHQSKGTTNYHYRLNFIKATVVKHDAM